MGAIAPQTGAPKDGQAPTVLAISAGGEDGASSASALTTMGRDTMSAVNATQLFAKKDNIALSVASIDPGAGIVKGAFERFASDDMNALFTHGTKRGTSGTLWFTL